MAHGRGLLVQTEGSTSVLCLPILRGWRPEVVGPCFGGSLQLQLQLQLCGLGSLRLLWRTFQILSGAQSTRNFFGSLAVDACGLPQSDVGRRQSVASRCSPRGHDTGRFAVDWCARVAPRGRSELLRGPVDGKRSRKGSPRASTGPRGGRRGRVPRAAGSDRAKMGLAVDAGSRVGLRR